MGLNLSDLVARTNLKKKKCVQQFLEQNGYTTLSAIQNLPGRYGQPWLCENGTTVVVLEIEKAIEAAAVEVPVIDEVLKVVMPEPEPEKPVLEPSTPITDLEVDGVTKRQLVAIKESGIGTLGELFENKEALEEVPGIGKATVDKILQAVTKALERK